MTVSVSGNTASDSKYLRNEIHFEFYDYGNLTKHNSYVNGNVQFITSSAC